MRKVLSILIIFYALSFSGFCLAQAPHQVGGFVLGKNISEYNDRLRMDAAIPVRHMEWINEVEIKHMDGFKSGYIWYGTCSSPGQIIRITLKYADPSKKYYERLLKIFKQRFGEPGEWRGDSFHIVLAWKWSFKDEKGNRIGLELQHNTRDEEMRKGNTLKLRMVNLIEEEAKCYEEKHDDDIQASGEKFLKPLKLKGENLDLLIPR